ncbi:MAG: divalent cation tolerance protein CutA [Candidatus Colwellbacteria bacterium]|nr:divalent cation tolerance protein CutA [Candidatus Colwellbacteria bacterium]
MKSIIWVLVNCNNLKEADKIGKELLGKRLIACYDVLPRLKTAYFWPPKSKKIESGKDAVLIGETLPKNFNKVYKIVKKKCIVIHCPLSARSRSIM